MGKNCFHQKLIIDVPLLRYVSFKEKLSTKALESMASQCFVQQHN